MQTHTLPGPAGNGVSELLEFANKFYEHFVDLYHTWETIYVVGTVTESPRKLIAGTASARHQNSHDRRRWKYQRSVMAPPKKQFHDSPILWITARMYRCH